MQSDLLDRTTATNGVIAPAGKGRAAWLRLLTEVLELAGPTAELLSHAERPWTSATFNGTRHGIAIAFTGQDALVHGKNFAQVLPDHPFDLPRHIVADATSRPVSLREMPMQLTVDVEILVLDNI